MKQGLEAQTRAQRKADFMNISILARLFLWFGGLTYLLFLFFSFVGFWTVKLIANCFFCLYIETIFSWFGANCFWGMTFHNMVTKYFFVAKCKKILEWFYIASS
jgi:hypothetical protein